MMKDSIGIDVSKDHLDVHCLSDGRAARFGNDAAGFRKLRAWLPKASGIARVVYEATGPYHSALERRFGGELPLVKENPLQARRFAQSTGSRAKTDAVPSRRLETNRLPGNRRAYVGADGGCAEPGPTGTNIGNPARTQRVTGRTPGNDQGQDPPKAYCVQLNSLWCPNAFARANAASGNKVNARFQ